ncbi:VanZ family protein [Pseudalkalibacillus decolorationis]|uniref:VanZ family protein n=1 Tax=Pseudalkalibacillus decolorationis TaxID=163879 RepID=UPI0021486C42|nr:VanZ family protein [Pseudalkalibacillus decolorationis]
MQIQNTPTHRSYARRKWKWIGTVLFLGYITVLIYSTLLTFNYYVYGKSFNLVLFESIELMWNSGNYWLMFKNIIGNILLFMPLGFLLPLIFRRLSRFKYMFWITFGTSTVIEYSQFMYANRIFDIDDIFLNGVGGLIGLLFFKICAFMYRLYERNVKRK